MTKSKASQKKPVQANKKEAVQADKKKTAYQTFACSPEVKPLIASCDRIGKTWISTSVSIVFRILAAPAALFGVWHLTWTYPKLHFADT